MDICLRKNSKLTPKMAEYSPAILTKSYVDSNKFTHGIEFLQAGKAFRVLECGFSEFYLDEKYRTKGIKNNIEWCQIEIMDRSAPFDCHDFFVKAEDLEPITDPDFAFGSGDLIEED